MNPFIESTVAHPLPKSHPDQRWSSYPVTVQDQHLQPSDITDLPSPESIITDVPSPESILYQSAATVPLQGDTVVQPDNVAACGTSAGVLKDGPAAADRPQSRVKSLPTILALSLCLTFSAVSGLLSTPVVLAGATAAVGMLIPAHAHAIDLNSATAHELQTLKGIGPKTAAMIVDERTRGGNFSSLTDLSDRVRGIGAKKAAALQIAGLKVGTGGDKGNAKTPPAQSSKTGKR